jgi:phospholipase/carboxylesterase
MQKQYDNTIVINPTLTPKTSIIWLHGLGASGHDFIDMVTALNLPKEMAVKFIFPHAPMREITLNGGYEMRAWFDIHALTVDAPQDEHGMKESLAILEQLVINEINLGIPSNRIVLAGFSQGAAVVLHAALSAKYAFAGILALSGFLLQKALPDPINLNNKNTPILMLHGKYDNVVPLLWAKSSKDLLTKLDFNIQLITYAIEHNVCEEEISDISRWLQDILYPHE